MFLTAPARLSRFPERMITKLTDIVSSDTVEGKACGDVCLCTEVCWQIHIYPCGHSGIFPIYGSYVRDYAPSPQYCQNGWYTAHCESGCCES